MYAIPPYKTTFGSFLPPLVCTSAHHVILCCLCLFAYCDVQHFFLCYVLCIAGVLKETGTAYTSRVSEFTPGFGGFHVVNLFGFLCFVFVFICLRPVSYEPNVARFSGLSIFECPFGFF